jgi:hypothetical protein
MDNNNEKIFKLKSTFLQNKNEELNNDIIFVPKILNQKEELNNEIKFKPKISPTSKEEIIRKQILLFKARCEEILKEEN